MPVWVIGFLIGMGVYTVRYEIHAHHKTPQKVEVVEMDQVSAKKFMDCMSGSAVAAGSPATLDCMEDYTNGKIKSN